MRSVVRTMRLKLTAKNTVGGRISRSSLITNARRRDLSMNGFLRTRGRTSRVQLELTNSTQKVLRHFHGRQYNHRFCAFSVIGCRRERCNYANEGMDERNS